MFSPGSSLSTGDPFYKLCKALWLRTRVEVAAISVVFGELKPLRHSESESSVILNLPPWKTTHEAWRTQQEVRSVVFRMTDLWKSVTFYAIPG
jgi:hypothetical protein